MAHDVALTLHYFVWCANFPAFIHICILRSLFNFQMYTSEKARACRKPHKPLPSTFFHMEQLSFVVFWCSRIQGQGHIQLHYFMLKAP